MRILRPYMECAGFAAGALSSLPKFPPLLPNPLASVTQARLHRHFKKCVGHVYTIILRFYALYCDTADSAKIVFIH